MEELRRRGYAADQSYEQRRTIREEASREVERLRATLSRFGGDLETQPDVVVARRSLEAARADLARAEADIEKAYVRPRWRRRCCRSPSVRARSRVRRAS